MILITQSGDQAINMDYAVNVFVLHKDEQEDGGDQAQINVEFVGNGNACLGQYTSDKQADGVFRWLTSRWSNSTHAFVEAMPDNNDGKITQDILMRNLELTHLDNQNIKDVVMSHDYIYSVRYTCNDSMYCQDWEYPPYKEDQIIKISTNELIWNESGDCCKYMRDKLTSRLNWYLPETYGSEWAFTKEELI